MAGRNPIDQWTGDAIERGDIDAIKRRAAEDPVYLTSRDYVGSTPLLTAIAYGHAELVEFLLARGADPNVEVDDGYTCLLTAVESESPSSLAICSMLIRAGADIHAFGTNGWTPLHMAASRGLVEKAKLLLDAGARIDQRKEIDAEETPLMEAAFMGRPDVVQLLLDRGADPSLRDTIHHHTALDMARDAMKGFDPETYAQLKAYHAEHGPTGTTWIDEMGLSPEEAQRLKQVIRPVDLAEAYRQSSDTIAREGDHGGVIRILERRRGTGKR